jgi:hypothetical protein
LTGLYRFIENQIHQKKKTKEKKEKINIKKFSD